MVGGCVGVDRVGRGEVGEGRGYVERGRGRGGSEGKVECEGESKGGQVNERRVERVRRKA